MVIFKISNICLSCVEDCTGSCLKTCNSELYVVYSERIHTGFGTNPHFTVVGGQFLSTHHQQQQHDVLWEDCSLLYILSSVRLNKAKIYPVPHRKAVVLGEKCEMQYTHTHTHNLTKTIHSSCVIVTFEHRQVDRARPLREEENS